MVVVVPPLVSVKLFAPSVKPLGMDCEDQDVPVEGADVIEKSAALPEELLIIASLEPVESLTTVAVTPRFFPLMLAATSFRVLTPLPVVMVAEPPAVVVIVNDDAGRAAVGLAARSENHDPVVA